MNKILAFSLQQRLFVLLLALGILGWGVHAYKNLPIDAFPDVSPVQVKIILKLPGLTPAEMESRITTPVERAMQGIPDLDIVRSITKYGLCDITLYFTEGTDIYWARQQVNERLGDLKDDFPAGMLGGIAPITTPLGEVYMFTIESDTLDLAEKRTLLDWTIAPRLRSIAGVADVNALGGEVKTYEIVPDMPALGRFGLTLFDLQRTLEVNNRNDGAGRINQGEEAILVRSEGRFKTLEDIRATVITNIDGRNVRVGDVAQVRHGALTRVGFVTKDGQEEAVEGLVLSLKGADASKLVVAVDAALADIETSLPEGTKIVPFYKRSFLVNRAVDTVTSALLEATVLIVVILLLFLGSFSSALTVALILPFAALMSFIAMDYFGITANLMSLGGLAIAIGMLVDSAVVMVENIAAFLGNPRYERENKRHLIYRACSEVALPVFTGILIIVIVFLPLLTLQGLEGKLFAPVALSIVFALTSSLILALTFIPVMASLIMKKHEEKEPFLMRFLLRLYRPSLLWALDHSKFVLGSVFIVLALALYLYSQIGKTFMPTLQEGNIIIGVEKIPSVSLEASRDLDLKIQQALLKGIPEIKHIIARTGSDEIGLDPMGLNDSDTFLVLSPFEEWREQDPEWLKAQLRRVLDRFPGISYGFTQPIEMRVSEMISGVRGDVAVKIFGEETERIDAIAKAIESLLHTVTGSSDVYRKANEGMEYYTLAFDKQMMGRYGLQTDEIQYLLKSLVQGVQIGYVYEGLKRIPMMIKGADAHQNTLSSFDDLGIVVPGGETVRLTEFVTFKRSEGAVVISHENGLRYSVVQTNVRGRDLVGFVDELKEKIAKTVTMPAGYFVTYGGQFENQQRAAQRLGLVIPIALTLIALLLFLTFQSMRQTLLVLVNIPLALIGGVVGLFLTGEYLSVPASVGFIALLGIAVLNGVVLVNYFNVLSADGLHPREIVVQGTLRRFRPVLMTATIAAIGLVPLLLATGPGSEIQKPLAIVVINGLVTSTLLTLIVLPILYEKFGVEEEREQKKENVEAA
jgi:cobalt-zinc-cadmium resistance protein CzcA